MADPSSSSTSSYTVVRYDSARVQEPDCSLWLSTRPGETTSPLKSVAQDPSFGYPVRVPPTDRKISPSSTRKPGSRASALLAEKASTVATSGLERCTGKSESIADECDRLFDEFSLSWDAYMSEHPEEAHLCHRDLTSPGTRYSPAPLYSEEAFHSIFRQRHLLVLNLILEKGQRVVKWWEDRHQQKITAPLRGSPASASLPRPSLPSDRGGGSLQVIASREAINAEGDQTELISAAQTADAGFYVVWGTKVIGTMKSKPQMSPHYTGVLLQDRTSPCDRVTNPEGTPNSRWADDLVLQLTSQMMAAGLHTAMLVADWGRILVPCDLTQSDLGSKQRSKRSAPAADKGTGKEKQEAQDDKMSLVFSATMTYSDPSEGQDSLTVIQSQLEKGLKGKSARSVTLRRLPNTILSMLAWILRCYSRFDQDREAQGRDQVPDAADDGSDNEEQEEEEAQEDGEGQDFSSKRPRRNPRRQASSSKRQRGMNPATSVLRTSRRGRQAADDTAPHLESAQALVDMLSDLPTVTRYLSSFAPSHNGTFATIHTCLISKKHLKSLKVVGEASTSLHGDWTWRLPTRPRPSEITACLKVQRRPLYYGEQDDYDFPKPRFQSDSDAPFDQETLDGIFRRTLQEAAVFKHCTDLQGKTIPSLYGIVSPLNYPYSTAHKLMFQSIQGYPLGSTFDALIYFWRQDLLDGIKEAFKSLHARGVWHGDVSNGNVLVEWRQSSQLFQNHDDSGRDLPEEFSTISMYTVKSALAAAQEEMGLADGLFVSSASSVINPLSIGGLADRRSADVVAARSPLEKVKAFIRPHIWIIDFSESKIFVSGEGQQAMQAEETRIQRRLIEWVEHTNPYNSPNEEWERIERCE